MILKTKWDHGSESILQTNNCLGKSSSTGNYWAISMYHEEYWGYEIDKESILKELASFFR